MIACRRAGRPRVAAHQPIDHRLLFLVVIQNGTRHAWRNKSEKPATMLFVLVGAVRN